MQHTSSYKGSIKKWLATLIVSIALFASFIAITFFLYWYTDYQKKQTLELAHTVGLVISQNVAKLILLNDVAAAADVTTALESFPNIEYMVLYKLDGTPVYRYGKQKKLHKTQKLPKNIQEFFEFEGGKAKLLRKVSYQGTLLGYVLLETSYRSVKELIIENIPKYFELVVIIFLFSYFLANYYARRFTNPILYLVKFLEKIDFNSIVKERVYIKRDDEYAHLYDEINMMLDRMEESYKKLRLSAVAFETQNGMVITDKDQIILDVNHSFEIITGYSKEEVIGKKPSILSSKKHSREFYEQMFESLKRYGYWSGEIINKKKNQELYPEFLTIQSVLDDDGEVIYYVASFVDLTLQKTMESQLNFLQKYDPLTGLANQNLLYEKINHVLSLKQNSNQYGVLLIVDIKDFKLVNEAYGYSVGDRLLQELAMRMETIYDASLICRVAQDRFALWFEELESHEEETAILMSKAIAEYIYELATHQLYKIDQVSISVNVYIGIGVYRYGECKNAQEIFQRAEVALRNGKKEENFIEFFNRSYQENAQKQLNIYTALVGAIQRKELELHYQPQYDADQNIYAVEALIRWNHPKEGYIFPDSFIPVAETTGLIVEIGDFVLEAACKQLQAWSNSPKTNTIAIAVNVSSKQFAMDDFIPKLVSLISKYAINPELLKIELTESVVVTDLAMVIQKMQQLKEIGCKISLDDFGTGYSSLSYLRDLPLDQVKIDKDFVQNMANSQVDIAIIRSVVVICQILDLEVIAEGVETKEDLEMLKNLGCYHYQGYFFSKPKKAQELFLDK